MNINATSGERKYWIIGQFLNSGWKKKKCLAGYGEFETFDWQEI